MKPGHHLRGLADDLRFAARSLRRSPVFAVTAITSLALGVAFAACTLSVLNSYLVRAMPFPHAERLYRALYDWPGQREPHGLEQIDWKSLSDVVEVVDYSSLGRFILHTDKYPQEISSLLCTPGSLDAIGVRAAFGRAFAPDDFLPGGERVIMISDALWRERYGSSPDVLGKTLRVSAAATGETPAEYRIIGVLPPGFRFVANYLRDPADTALPLRTPRTAYTVRLREGVPAGYAAQRITQAARSVAADVPAEWRGVRLESVQAYYVREIQPVIVGATIAAGLVLLIAVVNVAMLMLLRALRRQKETAVRVALGAEPLRIARLLVAEVALVCGAAVVAGAIAAATALRVLAPQIETRLGRPVPGGVSALAIDGTVLLWIVGLGVVATALIACVPILGARPSRLADSLRGEGRSGTDRPAVRRARAFLVTFEVAASTALLIGGGLMLRSIVHLMRTELGYETAQVFRPRLQLPASRYPEPIPFAQFYEALEEKLAALPQVTFALSTFVPFWEPPKRPIAIDRGELRASVTAVGPDYFRTLGIGLREGRAFTAADRSGSERVAVVSESLARELAASGNVLGRGIRVTEWSPSGESVAVWRAVVGVARDIHQTHADTELKDVYIPLAQAGTRYASIYLRAAGSPQQWLETIRTIVASIDPEVFVGPAVPLVVQEKQTLAGPRFITGVLTVFAGFAALLALLGIYGVTAYAVQQREREIAIRMAIGASSGAVLRMFFRRSLQLLLIGLAVGLAGGAALSRILQSQLHGVDRFDPWTLTAVATLVAAAGLLATWLPARRAVKLSPMTVLRAE